MPVRCELTFRTPHRDADRMYYEAACDAFVRMGREGTIVDDCWISIGERQGADGVFVTIWRSERTRIETGWTLSFDDESPNRPYRYDARFLVTTPYAVIAMVSRMLGARRQRYANSL